MNLIEATTEAVYKLISNHKLRSRPAELSVMRRKNNELP